MTVKLWIPLVLCIFTCLFHPAQGKEFQNGWPIQLWRVNLYLEFSICLWYFSLSWEYVASELCSGFFQSSYIIFLEIQLRSFVFFGILLIFFSFLQILFYYFWLCKTLTASRSQNCTEKIMLRQMSPNPHSHPLHSYLTLVR